LSTVVFGIATIAAAANRCLQRDKVIGKRSSIALSFETRRTSENYAAWDGESWSLGSAKLDQQSFLPPLPSEYGWKNSLATIVNLPFLDKRVSYYLGK